MVYLPPSPSGFLNLPHPGVRYQLLPPKTSGPAREQSLLLPGLLKTHSQLQQIGLPEDMALKVAATLKLAGDTPYHGGRLLNGKIYLLTNQDQLYYGTPQQLRKLELVAITRTRCFNHQVRTFETEDGLRLRVSNSPDKHVAQVKMLGLFGISIPLPHWRQVHFSELP